METCPTTTRRSRILTPPLKNGDRLTRAEFERRYDAMPGLKKAELIEGVVYIPPPSPFRGHARPQAQVVGWLGAYEASTPGVAGGSDTSIRLDDDNEPQPDALLMIDPARGGQAQVSADDHVTGSPELVAEVAASSASIELHTKLHVYRRNGVREYIVRRVLDQEIDWFVLRDDQYQRLTPDGQGVVRSEVFPGLWLDVPALLRADLPAVFATLQRGLSSPEHADFVARLAAGSAPPGP